MKRRAIMWFTRYCKSAIAISLFLLSPGCHRGGSAKLASPRGASETSVRKPKVMPPDTGDLERYLISKQLINVQSEAPEIRVRLAYATEYNFLHQVMYNHLKRCYLPAEVCGKLARAEHFLNEEYPQYHLVVFDGVRPLHIQKQMWNKLDMPDWKKVNYLANPAELSLHNYGAAVDVGIIDQNDSLLDMGTAFDTFSELSQPRHEARFLSDGALSRQAYDNRLILRRAMLRAGFSMMYTEWWHFNSTNKTIAAQRYLLIE